MKKILFVLAMISCLSSYGQSNMKLKAYLDTKQFYAPGIGNYIEIQLQYVGYTVKYLNKGNDLIGELAVQYTVSQGDSLIASDAYRLNTPVMKDSIVDDFYDLKKFVLEPGVYDFGLYIEDLNSNNTPVTANFKIEVDDFGDAISFSDVMVAESAFPTDEQTLFVKSGYHIIPHISTFYPEELTRIPAYFEIYNTNQLPDSVFAVKQYVVDATTEAELANFSVYGKYRTAEVVPVMETVDISKLPSGKYTLNFALMDRKLNEIAIKTYEFERSNAVEMSIDPQEVVLNTIFQESLTDDSLSYYLASLIPIARPAQVKAIISVIKTEDTDLMRKMMQGFWKETAAINMLEEWQAYKQQVIYVEKLYANSYQSGFETDRGRVYLQYGAPSRIIQREVSTSEYPYEIWEYNKIGVFSNRKFIFYNPDLVNRNYRLLHSDMVGELKNPNWAQELAKRNTSNGNVDNPNQFNQNSWGNNSREYYGQ